MLIAFTPASTIFEKSLSIHELEYSPRFQFQGIYMLFFTEIFPRHHAISHNHSFIGFCNQHRRLVCLLYIYEHYIILCEWSVL